MSTYKSTDNIIKDQIWQRNLLQGRTNNIDRNGNQAEQG